MRVNMAYVDLNEIELTYLYHYIKNISFKLYLGPC